MKDLHKSPRLYSDQAFTPETPVSLDAAQAHYLKSVLRTGHNAQVRLFNGRDGEWLGTLDELSKKSASISLEKQVRPQPEKPDALHLLFAPIKKNRMDFLIEKAVELGVTDLHPVITAHTEVRKLKTERIEAQIIEAAEQCERLTLPNLHSLESLNRKITVWEQKTPIFWAAERLENARNLTDIELPQAFLIGPEGGFDEKEGVFLQGTSYIEPISLGQDILRAETAALYCLSQAKLSVKR